MEGRLARSSAHGQNRFVNVNKSLSIAAVLVAGAALLTAMLKNGGRDRPVQTAAVEAREAQLLSQMNELQQNQAKLEKSFEALLSRVDAQASARVEMAPPELHQMERKLGELEAKQAQLDQATRDLDKYGVVHAMEKELLAAYSTLLDTNQPAWARAKQADQLKRYGHFDERATRAMLDLFANAGDNNERAAALSALKGTVSPEFRDQILTALDAEIRDGNQSVKFRYSAIEALQPMLPDPAIEQWMNYLAGNDPERKIAGYAAKVVGVDVPGEVPRK